MSKNKSKRSRSIMQKVMLILILIVVVAGSLWAWKLIGLYKQKAAYNSYWQILNTLPAPDESLIYVALGDSLSQGIGANAAENGFVGLLAESLGDKTGKTVVIRNFSKSGAVAKHVLQHQLPLMKSLQPNIVTLEIGANDILDWQPAQFKQTMDEVMKALPSNTVIADIPYFGGGRRPSLEDKVLQANQIIYELADKHGLTLAPVHKVTKERDSLWTYAADLYHPNSKGYINWHDAFWQIISDHKF